MHIDPGGILLRQEILIFSMFNDFLSAIEIKVDQLPLGFREWWWYLLVRAKFLMGIELADEDE